MVKINKKIKVSMISAIILFRNEDDESLLNKAKESVSWCDELILVNGVKGSFNDWRNEGLKSQR